LLVLDSKVLSTASPAQLDLTAAAGNYLQLASIDIDPKCEQQFRDKMKLAKFPSNSADVVVLNVGGHCHQTTVGTLNSVNYQATMRFQRQYWTTAASSSTAMVKPLAACWRTCAAVGSAPTWQQWIWWGHYNDRRTHHCPKLTSYFCAEPVPRHTLSADVPCIR